MKNIECPNCGTVFQVDDSTYESIVAHVRNRLFNEEIEKRTEQLNEQYKAREETIRIAAERDSDKRVAEYADRISELRGDVSRLSAVIAGYEASKQAEIAQIESQRSRELYDAVSQKDKRIAELSAELSGLDSRYQLKVLEEKSAGQVEMQKKDRQLVELRAELKSDRLAAANREAELRQAHQQQMRDKQDEIDRLKDFRLRLSTKMVGETLEQHCFTLFAQAQSMGLYPEASFDKDNTAVEHSKGDFIFRDYIDGQEYVSVMFEMKNEMDLTAAKHRNDDFLDKLDKDRQRKGCEYAVLVSMLEQGNELYDSGIVDKSHRYPKMLVIRPQFFLPVLRLITEATKKGFLERRVLVGELESARNQGRDFTKFEDRINRFREAFSGNVAAAHKKFKAATDGIDKTIEALEKQIKALREIKANFEASEQKLLRANEMAQEDLTVKKLTHGAPSIRRLIDDADKK